MGLPPVGDIDVLTQQQFYVHRERFEQFAVGQESLHRDNLAAWPAERERMDGIHRQPGPHRDPGRRISGSYFGVTVIVPFTQVMVPPVKSLCLPPGMSFSSLIG
ncbi:hypothetical protein IFM12276_07180 [Nocardia sputorum]|uniref:Uncharacterized protein n=1 Tax=Nocardia sputorum TaxID=2984338 RepID=A0ABM8CRU3_9NOCA|nr:hypothetical protein IFM12276_07180 [Nocardia sputorum]